MRLLLISGLFTAVITLPVSVDAQHESRFEFSVVAGAAHTDRAARLGAEAWIEPYAGIRADIRAFRTRAGVVGLQASYDHYAFGLDARVPPPCPGICATSRDAAEGLVGYHEAGSIRRLKVGASWQRSLVPWAQLEAAVLTGVIQGRHASRIGSVETRDPAPVQPLLGAQVGVSTRYRQFVAGLDLEFTRNTHDGTTTGRQNRVAVRMGYLLQ